MRSFALASLLAAATVFPCTLVAQINQAVWADPRPDAKFPPRNLEIAVPSHGEKLLGMLLLAAGERPHATAILLHGFPGYEQNMDLAQTLRRAGWNVLAVHDRGAWGTGGSFSFLHAMEDTDAMVNFVLSPENTAKYRIDTKRLIVIGHSMGGFLAIAAMAHHPQLVAGVVLTASNPVMQAYSFPPEDLAPLAGTSAEALRAESTAHATDWNTSVFVPKIAPRPMLVLTTEDGLQKENEAFVDALKKAGSTHTLTVHLDSDHGFSSRRVWLQSIIVDWLTRTLPSAPEQSPQPR